MADDEPVEIPTFDPTMKKKKKKRKKPVDAVVPEEDTTTTETTNEETKPTDDDDVEDVPQFDFTAKKKKKKKKPVATTPTPVEDDEDDDDLDDQSATNTTDQDENDTPVAQEDSDDDFGDEDDADTPSGWEDSDRDYDYSELLDRIFNILDENNPDLVRNKRSRMVMKPPSVYREGTKKTVWANFPEICKLMGRNPDHVLAYALAELGTNGSLDASGRLVIKGRFNPKQIESVIKHYIAEYVTCRTCKHSTTSLKKENRLYFVQCRACGSTRSVAAIKTGFKAMVGKRRRLRAKT